MPGTYQEIKDEILDLESRQHELTSFDKLTKSQERELWQIEGKRETLLTAKDQAHAREVAIAKKTARPIGDAALDFDGLCVLSPQDKMSDQRGFENKLGFRGAAASFGGLIRGLSTGNWEDATPEIRNALAESPSTAGGVLVPAPIGAWVIDLARAGSVCIAAGARTVPMESATLAIPRVTAGPGAGWYGENAEITAGSGTVFDAVTLSAFKLAGLATCSIELLEDANPNQLGDVIAGQFAADLALGLDLAALRGSGSGQPKGVLNQTSVQTYTAASGGWAISAVSGRAYQPIVQAITKVRQANGEPNAWVTAPTIAGLYDNLVDSTYQPLRAPATVEALSRFATSQIPTNIDPGTACSEIYVGNFAKMLIGVRTSMMLEVSRTAGNSFGYGQVQFRCYLRADVQLEQPTHFCVVQDVQAS